jgi:hypothetical protein
VGVAGVEIEPSAPKVALDRIPELLGEVERLRAAPPRPAGDGAHA